MLSRGKRLVRGGWRRLQGRSSPPVELEHALAGSLAPMACIDVGASFGIHRPWRLLAQSPQVTWVAVEPNIAEVAYLNDWPHPAHLVCCSEGLSGTGGERTLYITHNPNGSSILEPQIPASIAARSDYKGFFYPMRQIQIPTITLPSLLQRLPDGIPFVIKLDTQGSELEILRGAEAALAQHQCVGIELEASLLAEPPYTHAARFWEINGWLEQLGFELMRIQPICFGSRHAVLGGPGRRAPAECDALFSVRSDKVAALPPSHRLALLAFHSTNGFYEEAHALLSGDPQLRDLIQSNGGQPERIGQALWDCF